MNDVFKNLKTLNESLFESYNNGEITVRQAAEKFCSAGWTKLSRETLI